MGSSTTVGNGARSQWWLVIVLLILSTLAAIDRQVIALLVEPIRA